MEASGKEKLIEGREVAGEADGEGEVTVLDGGIVGSEDVREGVGLETGVGAVGSGLVVVCG